MTTYNKIAVHAFNRVFGPISEQLGVAESCDRHYDGGEWSGPAHANIAEVEFDKCLARIAPRFNMTADGLYADIMDASMEEQYHGEF